MSSEVSLEILTWSNVQLATSASLALRPVTLRTPQTRRMALARLVSGAQKVQKILQHVLPVHSTSSGAHGILASASNALLVISAMVRVTQTLS